MSAIEKFTRTDGQAPPEVTRPHWPVPGDWWFVLALVAGTLAGLTLRGDVWWAWWPLATAVIGAAVLAVRVLRRALASVAMRRLHTLARRHGLLVPLACSVCRRSLGLATAAFVDRHPAPLCASCRAGVDDGRITRPAVLPAPKEPGR